MELDTEKYYGQLQVKPKHRHYIHHHWADYSELLCLANIDGEISKSDLIDRLSERERDLFEGNSSDIKEIIDLEVESATEPTERCRVDELWTERVNSWFNVLQFRVDAYGDFYPFRIDGNELITEFDNTNIFHKYYIYYLSCSNLYLFEARLRNKLTAIFEVVSLQVIKNMLPETAIVRQFGSNPLNDDPEFGKNVKCLDKIKNLAELLNERIGTHVNEDNFPDDNFGDEGLDIVAWLPTIDNLQSRLLYFAQCACSKDWITKQSDSSYEAWGNKINFTSYPSNIVMIPFCYRNSMGNWFKLSNIRKCLLVDRLRLLSYLHEADRIIDDIQVFIDSLVGYKEPIF